MPPLDRYAMLLERARDILERKTGRENAQRESQARVLNNNGAVDVGPDSDSEPSTQIVGSQEGLPENGRGEVLQRALSAQQQEHSRELQQRVQQSNITAAAAPTTLSNPTTTVATGTGNSSGLASDVDRSARMALKPPPSEGDLTEWTKEALSALKLAAGNIFWREPGRACYVETLKDACTRLRMDLRKGTAPPDLGPALARTVRRLIEASAPAEALYESAANEVLSLHLVLPPPYTLPPQDFSDLGNLQVWASITGENVRLQEQDRRRRFPNEPAIIHPRDHTMYRASIKNRANGQRVTEHLAQSILMLAADKEVRPDPDLLLHKLAAKWKEMLEELRRERQAQQLEGGPGAAGTGTGGEGSGSGHGANGAAVAGASTV